MVQTSVTDNDAQLLQSVKPM